MKVKYLEEKDPYLLLRKLNKLLGSMGLSACPQSFGPKEYSYTDMGIKALNIWDVKTDDGLAKRDSLDHSNFVV